MAQPRDTARCLSPDETNVVSPGAFLLASIRGALEYPRKPALNRSDQRMLVLRRGRCGLLLHALQACSHLLRRRHVGPPPDGEGALKGRKTLPERLAPSQAR